MNHPVHHLQLQEWKNATQRVLPLRIKESNLVQKCFLKITQFRTQTPEPLNVFGVLARMDNIFPNYLLFMKNILFKGKISRQDKELVVLRLAWTLQCSYEWHHHEVFAKDLGISDEMIASLTLAESELWTERVRVIIACTDQLIQHKVLSDENFRKLKYYYTDDQIVEFCMLVGHYVMVAMTINTCGIQPEDI